MTTLGEAGNSVFLNTEGNTCMHGNEEVYKCVMYGMSWGTWSNQKEENKDGASTCIRYYVMWRATWHRYEIELYDSQNNPKVKDF